jgi:hypothetical protein
MIKTLTTGILVLTMFVGFLPPVAKAQKAAGPSPEANPNIDQCQNGPSSGSLLPCRDNWTNGALTPQDSQYREDESVSFRVVFTGLTPGQSYTLTIDYDTTKSGKHAYDYLTSYDRVPNTNPTNNNDPCGTGGPDNVPGCVFGSPSAMFPIPEDLRVTAGQDQILGNADDITQIPGVITFWGTQGAVTTTGYTLSGTYAGDSTTFLPLTFTAGPANVGATTTVVFAWGGHIASRLDWGPLNSAINISGRPYHMSLGNQELQTDVSAGNFPAIVTIIKQVNTPNFPSGAGGQSTMGFSFTQPLGTIELPSPFPVTLFDTFATDPTAGNETDPRADRVTFRVFTTGVGNPIEVTEQTLGGTGFSLTGVTCVEESGGLGTTANSGLKNNDLGTRTARIIAEPAEFIRCTFRNLRQTVTAGGANVTGQVVNSNGAGIRNAVLTATTGTTGAVYRATTNGFGYYSLLDLPVGDVYFVTIHSKTYTFANPTQTFTLNEDVAGIDFQANP